MQRVGCVRISAQQPLAPSPQCWNVSRPRPALARQQGSSGSGNVWLGGTSSGLWMRTGAGQWVQKNGHGKTQIDEIATPPERPEVVFIRSGPELWRTTNRGDSWTQLTYPFTPCNFGLQTSTPRSNDLLLSTGSVNGPCASASLWKSTDDGASWTRIVPPLNSEVGAGGHSARHYGNQNVIWLHAPEVNGGIIHRFDYQGGSRLNSNFFSTTLHVAGTPGDDNRAWSAKLGQVDTRVWRLDGADYVDKSPASTPGQGWRYFMSLSTDTVLATGVLAHLIDNGIWRTTNGGDTWSIVRHGSDVGVSDFNNLAYNPQALNEVWGLSTGARVLSSTDYGATWS
jgi:hypothetical protein